MKAARPYQAEATTTIWTGFREKPRQLCVLPTGSGKSFIINELMQRLAAVNYKTVLLLNREILVKQFARDLALLPFGIYAAGVGEKNKSQPITVAMIQSCHKEIFEDAKVIITDEAHNINDDGMYTHFIERHSAARVVGFTATPFNQNGYIYGEGKFFPRKDYFRTLEAMVADGWLVRPRSCVPVAEQFDTSAIRVRGDDYVLEELNKLVDDKAKARSQVKDALARTIDRKKVLWACLNVEHAETIKAEISKFEDVAIIHSKQTKAQQEANRAAFERGHYRHMVSVLMVTEGYDYPPADALVLLRPTRSAKLYVQIVGRVLRLAPGKKDALILDYGEIIKNLGSVYDPFVDRDRKKKAEEENIGLIFNASGDKVCPNCFELNKIKDKQCICGHEFKEQIDKNLKATAANMDIASKERQVPVTDVYVEQHTSKAGNECVRVDFKSGPFYYAQYFSAHPFSWGKGRPVIRALTGWDFETFEECYNNLEGIIVENKPSAIMIKKDGRYDKITKIIFKDEKTENPPT